jgi:hypothetical protein
MITALLDTYVQNPCRNARSVCLQADCRCIRRQRLPDNSARLLPVRTHNVALLATYVHACRLIADVFADNGFLTVVPDYFQGEPMNISLLETYEALPAMSLLGKLGGYAQLAGQVVGMVRSTQGASVFFTAQCVAWQVQYQAVGSCNCFAVPSALLLEPGMSLLGKPLDSSCQLAQ